LLPTAPVVDPPAPPLAHPMEVVLPVPKPPPPAFAVQIEVAPTVVAVPAQPDVPHAPPPAAPPAPIVTAYEAATGQTYPTE